ncbi:hypothetical protein RAS1_10070 [Phycisphaerae bacterium RAS1]|nr:hypothetical protein RAS1_10070 [Phycisphaerae bacterium RAS1]
MGARRCWAAVANSFRANRGAWSLNQAVGKLRDMDAEPAFTPEVQALLESYVYLYIDPRDGSVFYIGKGQGNRCFSHLDEQSESEKVRRIREIRDSGGQPRIEILRFALSDDEAALVEAAAIDLFGLERLTNRVRGEGSRGFGRTSLADIQLFNAPEVEFAHPAVLITLNRMYRSDMSELELYEATRAAWVIGNKRERARIALALFQGVVREVYYIERWLPAGTLTYVTRSTDGWDAAKRWEFEGRPATDLRSRYKGKSVRRLLGGKSQNPIRYSFE